jgi:hypothetical protein
VSTQRTEWLNAGDFDLVLAHPRIRSNPEDVKIIYPQANDRVQHRIEVRGTISELPPRDYQLWLVRIYSNGNFAPVQRVALMQGQTEWSCAGFRVGGSSSGDVRIIGAFLVGPVGQAMFAYVLNAAGHHNEWMDKLGIPPNDPKRNLPEVQNAAIGLLDMIECDRVRVIRDN